MTTASFDDHVPVLFEDDVGRLVKVEDGDAGQGGRGTAGLGHVVGLHEVDEGLDDGVVGGVHVGVQREGAFTVTVVGRVSIRSDNPILPT